jgi:hypothetical protein
LTAELSNNPDLSTVVAQLLPGVAKAVSFQHYPQHVVLLETLCRQVCYVDVLIIAGNKWVFLRKVYDCNTYINQTSLGPTFVFKIDRYSFYTDF